MKTIKTVAVIGAGGKLATPVIDRLILEGYRVKGLVRRPAPLPDAIQQVIADVSRVDQLMKALEGVDVVHINLSTNTLVEDLPFYAEREGVQNIITAVKANGVRQIIKTGALGCHPDLEGERSYFFPNEIRKQGHRLLEDSGLPFTIFHPGNFVDTLFGQIKGNHIQWAGQPTPYFWVTAGDYAKQLARAIGNPEALYKHFAVQGPELLDYRQAAMILKAQFRPELRLKAAPVALLRLLGILNPELRYTAGLFEYLEASSESFWAAETWSILGEAETTVAEFARRLCAVPAGV